MTKEAMKLALEALEGIHPGNMTPMAEEYWNNAITALREALAEQPHEIGARLACEGKGISDLWGAVKSDADMAEAQRGYEAALAQQPAQQEPVGRVCFEGDEVVWTGDPPESGTLLYTSPPAQRTWVGLTDEEVINVMPDDDTPMSLGEAFSVFAELIEAKLKEKNT